MGGEVISLRGMDHLESLPSDQAVLLIFVAPWSEPSKKLVEVVSGRKGGFAAYVKHFFE